MAFHVLHEKIGERVGLVSLKAKTLLGAAAMHVGIPLRVSVFIAEPVIETAAFPLGNADHLIAAAEMPFTDVNGVITGLAEGQRDCWQSGIEPTGGGGD